MLENLLEYASSPIALSLMLIVVSWIWEDAAVISGALLAADGRLPVSLAVVAVFVGICSGDLGLYYLGRLATRWRGLRRWILLNPKSRALSRRFRKRTFSNIMIVRFIPGLRTVGFTLCGLWHVSPSRFIVAMSFAGAIWIAVVFTLVYFAGASDLLQNSNWKWILMGLAAGLLIFNNLWAMRSHNMAKSVK